MALLRYGMSGPEVLSLQQRLRNSGEKLTADAVFGRQTELAVRSFQRKNGLLPDGMVGSKTLAALERPGSQTEHFFRLVFDVVERVGVALFEPATKARNQLSRIDSKRPCASMRISHDGLRFIFSEETDKNSGNVHFPGGDSGVTLGPGYDMRTRSAATIRADMRSLGLSAADAETMATAAGLTKMAHGPQGLTASTWCAKHPNWPKLSKSQEFKLLKIIVPKYEAIVHRNVKCDLWQYQFDALVSFCYNPQRSVRNVGHMIEQGKLAEAAREISSRTGTSPDTKKGLVNRRKGEVGLLLYGDYGMIKPIQ